MEKTDFNKFMEEVSKLNDDQDKIFLASDLRKLESAGQSEEALIKNLKHAISENLIKIVEKQENWHPEDYLEKYDIKITKSGQNFINSINDN
ncbi:hypothetical protein DSM07_01880 [Oenococcus sp. UCMA 16435]|nr:hypothetical protein DSM07_01880 [Oenococcus sp. UCMA 16435]MDI4584186.1 hypothetical protein [Oenococcus sp. UCMA 14587]